MDDEVTGESRGARPTPRDQWYHLGETVRLVRWVLNRDSDWVHDEVLGGFVAKRDESWTLEVDGIERSFDRPEWATFKY